MNTCELIIKLVDSLTSHGNLPTNINNISWLCTSEGGDFEKVILNTNDDSELEGGKDEKI